MKEAENLLSEWSQLLMASLADAGVRDVVMSPGSRSTPFVAAALREPRLRIHSVIDERAASFFALGQARVTGMPSVLLCTSGTAGAHYLPAAIEANASALPLLVLTADRPTELMDCGAPQTIDQTKLLGDHALKFIDIGHADPTPLSLRALRRMAAQAVIATLQPARGTVHVNARARKPLEPVTTAVSDAGKALAVTVVKIRAQRISRASAPRELPDDAAVAEVAELVGRSERGLIVCGPVPIDTGARDAVMALAKRTRFPVLAELPSQLRLGAVAHDVLACDGFDAFMRSASFRNASVPDLVVQIGSTPTSTGFEQFCYAYCDVPRVVFADRAWTDPASTSTHFVVGDIASAVRAVANEVPVREKASAWSERFAEASRTTRAVVDDLLSSSDGLTEGKCARAVIDALPGDSGLMLANSLPLRTAEAFGQRRDVDVKVFCQRGANGIDGLLAGSVGSAIAMKRPFTLFIGDVSLLHDLTSLALAKNLSTPFVIVVVNNQGGRIFEQLPLGGGPANNDDELRKLFESTLHAVCTPHSFEFSHAAAMFGIGYSRVKNEVDLRAALTSAYGRRCASVIEVTVPPHGAVDEYRRLWRGVEARLPK